MAPADRQKRDGAQVARLAGRSPCPPRRSTRSRTGLHEHGDRNGYHAPPLAIGEAQGQQVTQAHRDTGEDEPQPLVTATVPHARQRGQGQQQPMLVTLDALAGLKTNPFPWNRLST